VNQLFGDIVKVTLSSKVVGDMTMFLTRGIQPADVLNLEPGATPFPGVVDMLSGGLGWPRAAGATSNGRLGEKRAGEARRHCEKGVVPGAIATPANIDKVRRELAEKLKHDPSEDDVYSYLMYPRVFLDFARHEREFGDVGVLPTTAFFYGLRRGEEISVDIEAGKTLVIRLVNVSEPDKDGRRTLTYELNGITREASITDRKIAPQVRPDQGRHQRSPPGGRAHPRPHRQHRGQRRPQGRQGRQTPHARGHEDANHHHRAPRRHRGLHPRRHRRDSRERTRSLPFT
jgi:pyruvate carboxylase